MKKSRLLVPTLFFSMLLFSCSNADKEIEKSTRNPIEIIDFLHTGFSSAINDYTLFNDNNERVILKGTNAGGWLVQENWLNATDATDQMTTLKTLTSRFGNTQAQELLDIYMDNYWTEEDFDNCVELGFNCIRLPFTYMNLLDDCFEIKDFGWEFKDDAFAHIDWFVENCQERGIYVILDLHGAPGSQNGHDHSGDVNHNDLFLDNDDGEFYREKTVWIWETIAERYKDNPTIAGYDLLNEPSGVNNKTEEPQWEFYNTLYSAVRDIDENHIIIIESCWGTENIVAPSKYGWENIMYEYHAYLWGYYDQSIIQGIYNSISVFLWKLANHKVPILCGEFTFFSEADSWETGLSTFNRNNIHWITWNYRATGASTWGLYNDLEDDRVAIDTDDYETIAQKWSLVGSNTQNEMLYPIIKKYSCTY